MNFRTVMALSAIVASTALPLTASAQARGTRDRDRDQDRYDRRDDRWNNRRRDDNRRYDDRWNNRRNDRWNNGRRDDRWDDRRRDDRWDNRRYDDRWDDRRYDDRRDDRWNDRRYDDRRQDSKNEWRNIAIGAGALSLLGLLSKDSTLTFAGALGALYSIHRYEQDRKSQNSYDRARARFFDYDHFYRDGVRYDRRTVTRNGQRYYQFERSR